MLIAEDLVLLMLEDFSGRPLGGLDLGTLDILVGGALVSELALSGAVHLVMEPVGRTVEVHPTGVRVPADPCLQRSLELAGGRARPASLIRSCGIQMFEHLADRLVHRGLLRRETQRRHLVTRTVWPAAEVSYKQDVRHHLTAALFYGAQPSRRTATLIGLLTAVDHVEFFPSATVSPTEVRRRAGHIAGSDWAAAAVRGIFRASRRRGDWFGGGDGGGFFGGDGGGGGGGDGGGG